MDANVIESIVTNHCLRNQSANVTFDTNIKFEK